MCQPRPARTSANPRSGRGYAGCCRDGGGASGVVLRKLRGAGGRSKGARKQEVSAQGSFEAETLKGGFRCLREKDIMGR